MHDDSNEIYQKYGIGRPTGGYDMTGKGVGKGSSGVYSAMKEMGIDDEN